ncbi:DUF6350 family protein [Streptomyces sp. CAU 1734]|uniref:cell division protein PerM n=1 Tax=Streptomyces sp. CAU 1734 TaxID=3140360 RepID=UPI0032614E26
MTQTTDRGPVHSTTPVLVQGGRRAALVACLVRGATAAGLGLGALAVLVMVVWISSPYPDNGPDGALHIAAGLWLMAHGTELIRTDTLSGQPAPVGVVPLLLVVLPVWLVHRAARDGVIPDPAERRPRPSPRGAICAVSMGYLLVGAVVAGYSRSGSPAVNPLSALVQLPLVTVLAACAGVWTAKGRPAGPLPKWLPGALRLRLVRTRVAVALRAACAGALVLFGGGAVLVALSLVWHGEAVREAFPYLSEVWSGQFTVLLLAFTLVPNAAAWGAAYGLGPGFALGTGASATPLALSGDPAVPVFPLLAAVPAEGAGTPLNWACALVPVLAGLVIAGFTTAAAAPRFVDPALVWRNRETALTAFLGAVGCGVLTAAMTAAAAGPMGSARLLAFGPVWWLAGAAALAWSAVIAVPLATAVRMWRAGPGARVRRWLPRWPGFRRGTGTAPAPATDREPPSAPQPEPEPNPPTSGPPAPSVPAPVPASVPAPAPVPKPAKAAKAAPEAPAEAYDFLPELPRVADGPPHRPDPPEEDRDEEPAGPSPDRPWAAPASPWPQDPDPVTPADPPAPPAPAPKPEPEPEPKPKPEQGQGQESGPV